MNRPYDEIAGRLQFHGDRRQRMRILVDALWDGLSTRGISWVGFYLPDGQDELTLGPMRDKPACSPIGMHGACGRAFRTKRPLIVREVANLGANYVACDPRDKSELVIPLFEADGSCWGVLDFDSHETGAFGPEDLHAIWKLLQLGELTRRECGEYEIR